MRKIYFVGENNVCFFSYHLLYDSIQFISFNSFIYLSNISIASLLQWAISQYEHAEFCNLFNQSACSSLNEDQFHHQLGHLAFLSSIYKVL